MHNSSNYGASKPNMLIRPHTQAAHQLTRQDIHHNQTIQIEQMLQPVKI